MAKKILITGGCGFIGSHLAQNLIQDNHDVVICDDLTTGNERNLDELMGHPIKIFCQDIVDGVPLDNYDEIYHLASPASPPRYMLDPIRTLKTNTIGTLKVLELAKEVKAKVLIASTSEIYGNPLEHPQEETYWGNTNPIGPRSCYDEGKRVSESLAQAFKDQENVDIRIARIFNTYGPRMQVDDGRVVSNFINQALSNEPLSIYGDGSQSRSFQYISDLISGLRQLMSSEVDVPVNLGNPEEITVLQLASLVRAKIASCNSEIKYEPLPKDDPIRRRPNIDRARELLHWTPKVSLEEGLGHTIEYFRQMRIKRQT